MEARERGINSEFAAHDAGSKATEEGFAKDTKTDPGQK